MGCDTVDLAAVAKVSSRQGTHVETFPVENILVLPQRRSKWSWQSFSGYARSFSSIRNDFWSSTPIRTSRIFHQASPTQHNTLYKTPATLQTHFSKLASTGIIM
jgi:hypothetical protein